jgi:hypothetical protein
MSLPGLRRPARVYLATESHLSQYADPIVADQIDARPARQLVFGSPAAPGASTLFVLNSLALFAAAHSPLVAK